MNEKVTKAIIGVIQTMMDRVMDRVLVLDPFVAEKHHANKPLYAALVYNPQNEMLAFCKTKCSIRKTKRIFLRVPSYTKL